MAAFGKLSGTVVEHAKLQPLHEFKRDPTGIHLFSSHLIKPIPGRCLQIQSPGMRCAMLWMD